MKDADLAAAVDANYSGSFALLARSCGGAVLERDDAIAICTGLPLPMLNHGFVRRPPADPEGLLGEMIEFFDKAGVPFIFRVRDGVAPGAEQAMEAMGYPYSDTAPGMAMFPVSDAAPVPPGLTIEAVQDKKALDRYQQVMADGFGMPLDLAKRLIARAFLDVPGFESYLGLVDDEAVATSSLYASDGAAGVYSVATLPGFRRRGFGEAMTWHAVMRGREQGCKTAILQASAMGKPVYERMGFRTVAPHRTFQRKAES
jgi:GNAT superfamily N-acetyltransferase